MHFPAKQRLTERPILRVLIVGFALVVILLGLAGAVAVSGTRAIEDDTADVVREQLLIARLLNDVQVEQNALASILHRISHAPESLGHEELLRSLNDADTALSRIADSAAVTPEAQLWRTLNEEVRRFSATLRDALEHDRLTEPELLSELFDEHDQVVRLEQEVLRISEGRIEQTERNIETESEQLGVRSRVLLGSSIVLALLCAIVTIVFARRSIRRMEWQAQELTRVSWHMLQGQEAAARRFSHELHDELGQALAAIKANINSSSDWAERKGDCIHLVDDAIANVRELSQLLRPVILDDFGVDAGLRWLTDRFGERTGIETKYDSNFHDRLPEAAETHLFRITQEALTNVARHSGATRAAVSLHYSKGEIQLTIEDNGRGLIPSEDAQTSLGMTGMRARAAQTGGEMVLSTPDGGGVRILVTMPWVPAEVAHGA